MISAKKLIKLARKWQSMVALRQKRITFPRSSGDIDAECCSTSSLAKKGHFVVYSADQRRFVLPLEYLKNQIVKELLQLAEEEWGLPGTGLLTLPWDASLYGIFDCFDQKACHRRCAGSSTHVHD